METNKSIRIDIITNFAQLGSVDDYRMRELCLRDQGGPLCHAGRYVKASFESRTEHYGTAQFSFLNYVRIHT